MKSKRIFQIFILLTLLFSPLGNVSASTEFGGPNWMP